MAAVVPFQPGSRFQDGAYRLTLGDVRLTEGGPRVGVIRSDATSIFDMARDDEFSYFLRNRSRGEAISGDYRGGTPDLRAPAALSLGRLATLGPTFGFLVERGTLGFPTSMDSPDWLADAELVVIRSTPRGVLRRSVRLDHIAVNRPAGS